MRKASSRRTPGRLARPAGGLVFWRLVGLIVAWVALGLPVLAAVPPGSAAVAGAPADDTWMPSRLLAEALWKTSSASTAASRQAPAQASQAEPEPTCASCHEKEAATQPLTGMGRALVRPGANPLAGHAQALRFTRGIYRYAVQATAHGATYSVTDGQQTITVPILWSFGADNMTWLLEYQGKMYESLVSFYAKSNGLGITTGDTRHEPATLLEAFGRLQTGVDVKVCFGCHATSPMEAHPGLSPGVPAAASAGARATGVAEPHSSPAGAPLSAVAGMPDPRTLEAGVQCEHCHLNSARHLLEAPDGNFASTPPSLGKLSTEEMSNFCGQCHRSWGTVVRAHWRGPVNVRFAPYRLANSKCYNGSDSRIGCTACHNPHENAVRDARFYDGKCLACHLNNGGEAHAAAGHQGASGLRPAGSGAAKPRLLEARFESLAMTAPLGQSVPAAAGLKPFAPACPVAKKDCTSCHMPKVTLPDSSDQLQFTDHQIRVVRAGEPYPN